jgi:hypothetical protein
MYFPDFSLARFTAELGPCSKLHEDPFRVARAPEGLPHARLGKRVAFAWLVGPPVLPPFETVRFELPSPPRCGLPHSRPRSHRF